MRGFGGTDDQALLAELRLSLQAANPGRAVTLLADLLQGGRDKGAIPPDWRLLAQALAGLEDAWPDSIEGGAPWWILAGLAASPLLGAWRRS